MRKRRWEQRFNLRPSQKSMASRPRRARYTQADLDAELLEGMKAAEAVGREIERRRCEQEIRRRALDKLLDVADAVGVTPMDGGQAGRVGDDAERWLTSRDDYLRMLHDEERAAGRRCGWECWRCERG